MTSFSSTVVKREMAPLDLTAACSYSPEILAYFNSYGLNLDVPHYFGSFRSQDFTCAAHVFDPGNTRGTVFLLHGYYDHTGVLKNIIRLCTEEKLRVAVFDFPGHGLSSGIRASIDSFSQYLEAFKDFFEFCKTSCKGPYYLIGHSMGGAVALEYLFQTVKPPFQRVVLCAPLVRSSFYRLSRVGYFIMSPFTGTTQRWFRRSSSDKQFLKSYRIDPLQCKHFPMRWAKAYYFWYEQAIRYEPVSIPVTVIQGTKDKVVDWRYNIPFIKKKLQPVEVIYIKRANHQLMNEAQPFLTEFLKSLRGRVSTK